MARITSIAPLARALRLLSLVPLLGCSSDGAPPTLVAAASSLRHAMPEIVQSFEATRGSERILVTYGGSGTLRAQVAAGAPIDVVVFAGAEPVDRLIAAGHVAPDAARVVATNELVLIAPLGASRLRFATLDHLAPGQRIAIGHPDSAPVGAYTRDLLQRLGLWDALGDRLVYGGHVAAVLTYVRRGEVAAGVVYRTDSLGVQDVAVLDAADGGLSDPPQIVAAATSGARDVSAAESFVAFLSSRDAAEILMRHGFSVQGRG